ncbi:(2Fe-2S)-binding protein [Oecophyllibacter saccharovorans]|nr:(2Fe-2S)-binding protein [Oecophyllibacter saccharovorans]
MSSTDATQISTNPTESHPSAPEAGSRIRFVLNGQPVTVDAPSDTPLLWILRDTLALTGTKYGCGIGECGACTVHVGGQPTRSCITPLSAVQGASVTTIEGLDAQGQHPVQQAWLELQVPQCGYCQSGQIMQAAALLRDVPSPTDDEIDAAMSGNLCRCMTYRRIRKAIHAAASANAPAQNQSPARSTEGSGANQNGNGQKNAPAAGQGDMNHG